VGAGVGVGVGVGGAGEGVGTGVGVGVGLGVGGAFGEADGELVFELGVVVAANAGVELVETIWPLPQPVIIDPVAKKPAITPSFRMRMREFRVNCTAPPRNSVQLT